jgi:predicted acylesterase/phospholipase RssA
MLTVQRARGAPASEGRRVGLAVAAGGPLGGTYEVGALLALDEALVGVDFNALHAYVGVSAGSFIAAGLANHVSTSQMAQIFITSESHVHNFHAGTLFTPAYREFRERVASAPAVLLGAVRHWLRRPQDFRLLDAFTTLSRLVPTGLFDNEPLQRILAEVFSTRGRTNDFRRLAHQLYVVAVDLDTGQSVAFGSPGRDHVPISKACQASGAMPGLYPPVEIDDRYYVDGALQTTMHASLALDAGCDLVLGINPIVPYDIQLTSDEEWRLDRLADGGLPVVLSQTIRAIIHSRMKASMRRYADQYADKDVILFEPDRGDSRMFFTNAFSYHNRERVCQHAYERTRADLLARRQELEPILARHGIRLRTGLLRQSGRHFTQAMSVPLAAHVRSRQRNRVTNELSASLDRLEHWVAQAQRAAST